MPSFRVRPSKYASCITVIVGIGMLIFFLTERSKFGGSGLPIPGGPGGQFGQGGSGFDGFMVLFVIALICVIGYHAFNALTDRGAPHEVIDMDPDDGPSLWPDSKSRKAASRRDSAGSDERPAERLRELQALLDQKLISQSEYDRKRQKILEEI